MNLLDICVIAIFLFFGISAYRKGFVKACFSSLPMFIALAATYLVQPIANRLIRATPLYESFKNTVIQSLGLEKLISETALQSQAEMIQQMPLPDFLKSALIENNNPVVYQILNVSKIEDYIGGYLANICINIITVIGVFLIALIAAKFVLAALNFVSQLPILNFFNKIGGLAVGLIQGTIVVWIAGIVLTFFNYNPQFQQIFILLDQSFLAEKFYENNLLMFMILKIFG